MWKKTDCGCNARGVFIVIRGEIVLPGCKKLSFTTPAHLLERKKRRKRVLRALIDG
jgi:hypothetical protein